MPLPAQLPPEIPAPKAARFLESALIFTFFTHAAGMVSMALLLLPAMPGGQTLDVAVRAAYVANHPWLWRIGWLPWQITALSDLLLAVALVRTSWIPRLPAWIAVIATIAAIVPDQYGQFLWTWPGIAIAQSAALSANLSPYYRDFESHVFHLIAGFGTIGYLTGAIAWTWCFAAAGVWSKRLAWLSITTWSLFAVVTTLLIVAQSQPNPAIFLLVSIGNALAFVLLMIWLIDVTETVLRRSRLGATHGRFARWRHPSRGSIARLCDLVGNSRFAMALCDLLPALAMDSDITDVIYVNYLVEADRLEPFVVAPLKLQRLGPGERYALFTFLTFHHGHFGPRCFGPLRRLWPSPVQSNWRIHVYDPRTAKRGIQFLTIAISGTPHALAARMLAENVPMHVPAEASLSRSPDGTFALSMKPGDGTAPDAQATFRPITEPALNSPWKECFETWRGMLAYCVPQDRAMSAQPWINRVTRQEIALNIPLESCRPLSGEVTSNAATQIAGDAKPLCFLVEKLAFRLLDEEYDRYE